MPTPFKQYNILFSCPSDMQNLMKNIEKVLHKINSSFASDRIAFNLLSWTRDVKLGLGRPQDIINSQIVIQADAVIALFGGKLGTPTEKYPSGTIEEISIIANSKKQVFVLFSKYIDSETKPNDLRKMQKFKREFSDKGIYSDFNSDDELENILHNQLRMYGDDLRPRLVPILVEPPIVQEILNTARHNVFISGTGMSFLYNNCERLAGLNPQVELTIAVTDFQNEYIVDLLKHYFGKSDNYESERQKKFQEACNKIKASRNVNIIHTNFFMNIAYVAVDYNQKLSYSFISAKHYLVNNIGESTDSMNLRVTPEIQVEIYDKYLQQITLIINRNGQLAKYFPSHSDSAQKISVRGQRNARH